MRPFGLQQTLAPAGKPGPQENNAGICVCGMNDDPRGLRRMDPKAVDLNTVRQGGLKARFHQFAFPVCAPNLPPIGHGEFSTPRPVSPGRTRVEKDDP